MLGFTKQELRIVGFLVVSLLVGATARLYRYYFSDLELAEVDPVFVEKFKARSDSLNNGTFAVSGGGQPVAVDSPAVAVFPVNINTATGVQLQRIPKIGPVLARKIVEQRDVRGGFATIDDLLEVRGIGKKTLDRIGPYIVIK